MVNMTNLKKKQQQLTIETDMTMCAATFNDQDKTVFVSSVSDSTIRSTKWGDTATTIRNF